MGEPASGTGGTPNSGGGGANPEPSVLEQVQNMLAQEKVGLEARLNGLSAALNRLGDEVKGLKKPKSDEPPIAEAQRREEEAKRAKEAEEALSRAKELCAVSSVRLELQKGGSPPDRIDRLTRLFLAEKQPEVSVEGKVVVREGDATTPLDKFLPAYLKTPEGAFYLPQKTPPPPDGLHGGGRASAGALPSDAELASKNYHELMELAKNPKTVNQVAAWMVTHPQEWDEKRRTAGPKKKT